MEQGLAAQMVYGNGEGQNTTHYYAGTLRKGVQQKMKKNIKKGTKKGTKKPKCNK